MRFLRGLLKSSSSCLALAVVGAAPDPIRLPDLPQGEASAAIPASADTRLRCRDPAPDAEHAGLSGVGAAGRWSRRAGRAHPCWRGAAEKQSIDVQYYIWQSGHDRLAPARRVAAPPAERGVRVRLLLDDNGKFFPGLDNSCWNRSRREWTTSEVRIFNPLHDAQPQASVLCLRFLPPEPPDAQQVDDGCDGHRQRDRAGRNIGTSISPMARGTAIIFDFRRGWPWGRPRRYVSADFGTPTGPAGSEL